MTTHDMTRSSEGGTPSSSSSSSPSSAPLLAKILSGSVGSIVTALAVTPLEVVKIRQQTAPMMSSASIMSSAPIMSPASASMQPCPGGCGTFVIYNRLAEGLLPQSSTPHFETTTTRPLSVMSAGAHASVGGGGNRPSNALGTLETLRHISRAEGTAGLYAGLRPTLVMSVPNAALYFTSYDELSSRLRAGAGDDDGNGETSSGAEKTYAPLIAGAAARLLATLATAPLELIRTRQASLTGGGGPIHSNASPPGVMEEFRFLLRTRGPASLYAGVGPTLWRDVPFSALYWLCLERFRDALADSHGVPGLRGGLYYRDRGIDTPPLVQTSHAFVSGAAAGTIAAALTTPFDVVKTRRQTGGRAEVEAAEALCDSPGCGRGKWGKSSAVGYGRINEGTFGHMRLIVEQEGWSGLWRGNQTRMAKVAPACAIMISCYEVGKRAFGEDPLR